MSDFREIILWSELRHAIIALELKAAVRKLADGSKRLLGYVPAFLGGPGPSDSFWETQRRTVALRDQGLSLDELNMRELNRWARGPTREEKKAQEERELPFLHQLINRTYEVYKKDYDEQGKKISPAFLWVVYKRVFISVTLNLLEAENPNEYCLHLPMGFAPANLGELVKRLPRSPRRFQVTNYIRKELKNQVELEALKLDSIEQSRSKEEPAVEPEQGREVSLRKSVAGNQKRSGRKRDDRITDRNKEIAALAFSEKTPLEIAKHLDARNYSVPDSWTIVEDDGDQYQVGSFEKAYYAPQLRRKLNDLIYNAKKSGAEIVGQSS